jgi:preprotein translocase subunit SecA
MDAEAVDDVVIDMRSDTVNAIVGTACPPNSYPEQWDVEGLKRNCIELLALDLPIEDWLKEEAVEPEMLAERIQAAADAAVDAKAALLDKESWHAVEKNILLQSLDHHWKEHLATLDSLRSVIHLRAYAQKTPINEYKQEAFALFERMLIAIREDVTRIVAYAQFNAPGEEPPAMPGFITTHVDPLTGEDDTGDFDLSSLGLVTTKIAPLTFSPTTLPEGLDEDPANWEGKVGRNQPCPCGSGQKYKHCHGASA